MKPVEKWIVIFQQVVGGDGKPMTTAYSWDGKKFKNFNDAKSHGFKTRGSDDFNLGKVKGKKLIDFTWMGYSNSEYEETLKKIQKEICL